MVRHFAYSGPIEHISMGCSHTRMHHLPVKHRWPVLIYNELGIYFEHHRFSQVGARLSVLYERAKRQLRVQNLSGKIKSVVIQKPGAIRCPWWGEASRCGYPGNMGNLSGRRESYRRFLSLRKKERNRVADKIYDIDLEYLKKIVDLFPGAKFAYYYWIDDIRCQLDSPELVEVNQRLGQAVEGFMTNFGKIVDPKDIPGVYDDEGDLVFNAKKIYKEGWILSPKDIHPGKKYSSLVAERVKKWL